MLLLALILTILLFPPTFLNHHLLIRYPLAPSPSPFLPFPTLIPTLIPPHPHPFPLYLLLPLTLLLILLLLHFSLLDGYLSQGNPQLDKALDVGIGYEGLALLDEVLFYADYYLFGVAAADFPQDVLVDVQADEVLVLQDALDAVDYEQHLFL
jgi:hypothetical protein